MRNDHTAYRTTNHAISFKFIILTILFVLLYAAFIFAQQTVTELTAPQNGTMMESYDNWDDVAETSIITTS